LTCTQWTGNTATDVKLLTNASIFTREYTWAYLYTSGGLTLQSAYNSGKSGNLREFLNSEKLGENSGNFNFTPGIIVSVIMGIEFCA